MRNAYGLCWRTGYWTSTESKLGCDGELVLPIAKAIAPVIVTSPETVSQAPDIIPTTPITAKRCDFTVILENSETFAFDKAALTIAAQKRIDNEVINKLNICEKLDSITVTGHTDNIGTQEYNQELSAKRASNVVTYLKNKGISTSIDSLSAGATQLIQLCDDKTNYKNLIQCLAPNRRVAIEVHGTTK
jgi:OOP family OmpA-OmpF porin